ncbi:hypothetical protein FSARC_4299 [Fusarium sarcochroum]|uniref:ABC transporter domain-containing protein n=1 Tax=Fusarium sarcochroum TaxID=1208366 RepID=A0A8H4U236_9HYPO|nr:hypothetical protein FSARC_4299 [Fusarium sarcochroum]
MLSHSSAEAIAAMIMDLPYKIVNALCINVTVYFMCNLRREASPFFFFFLLSFLITLNMSMLFRFMGPVTKTVSQALAPSAIMLGLDGYAGSIQSPILKSLVLGEFVRHSFPCMDFVPSGPGYDSVSSTQQACSVKGSIPGQSTGEVLVFSRDTLQKRNRLLACDEETVHQGQLHATSSDATKHEESPAIEKQKSSFHWQDVCYAVNVKGETRKILYHVDGWVKPGTLTALMGVSVSGKTGLLDVLASRVTMGVITGQMLVDGLLRDSSFQRETGYVTQQDLHLHTATVREALSFSAILRQPSRYSKQEKLSYVDEVIDLVSLEDCADAVIGSLGEGLNAEQRKRLTIGVELPARPELLLLLDEPTSGLDSQTSWAICDLMQKLNNNGQAILCTIHPPSAALFQRFERLLLLARGGRAVYFGNIGRNSQILVDYLNQHGAAVPKPDANPAECMHEVIDATPKSKSDIDWPSIWRESPEYKSVQEELARLFGASENSQSSGDGDPSSFAEFAVGFPVQLVQVTKRSFQQYWRTPSYIFSKSVLTAGSALFIRLSQVNGNNTERGLLNQILAVYIFLFIFSQVVEQMIPKFVTQRLMHEARERPAKAYAWMAFLIATMLHVWGFLLFSSTFANTLIAGVSTAEIAGGLLNLLFIFFFSLSAGKSSIRISIPLRVTSVNIILAGPNELPGVWISMYRINPFTYAVERFLATSLANAPVSYITNELIEFAAPSGMTCGEYMKPFITDNGGYVVDDDTGNCQYCPMADTNTFLASINMSFSNSWRDFGLIWAYCIFNVVAAAGLYWLIRVPKNDFKSKKSSA